jgi:hypothetical protein
MSDTKWDFADLAKMKRAANAEMDIDIQKLKTAVQLISEVEETLSEAFWSKASKGSASMPKLDVSAASAPARLARAMSEVNLVANCLDELRKRI